jgi:glycosyltransferase involved in cell wall biosynthesis
VSRPLHIAVDANVLEADWGGIPKHLHRIAAELVAGGDRVDLLVNLRRWSSPVPGARAVPLRLRGRGLWRDLAVPLWALRHRPDVLWAPETELPRRIGVPTVVTVHDLAPLLFPGTKPPAVERRFRGSIPRSVRSATRVICVSHATARDVRSHWGVERLDVIGNGVDDRFAPGDPAAERVWAANAHGLDRPFVLHVGSLEPRRGLDVLIDAAARSPGWRLVLAGRPGHDGERILAAAQRAGAAWLPDVDDDALARLYRAALVVAVPSLYEGFGMVALEAMASGTPTAVAADAGALGELAGAAAVGVSERSAEAWMQAIASADERRAQLVPAGLRLATRHRWPAVAAAVRGVLAEAAGDANRGLAPPGPR